MCGPRCPIGLFAHWSGTTACYASRWEDSAGSALGLAATGERVVITDDGNAEGLALRGGWYEGLGALDGPRGGALNLDGAGVSVAIRDSSFVGCKAEVRPSPMEYRGPPHVLGPALADAGRAGRRSTGVPSI
jgi:hypothetical protein